MKKIILLLLFVSGFAYAQPSINNPVPYQVCDNNTDGVAAFDLNVITPTLINVAGTQISYHLTLTDSQLGTSAIDQSAPFTNTVPFNQTIYIRAWDVAEPGNPAFTTLNLIVSQRPTATISSGSACVGNSITVTTIPSPAGSYNFLYTTPSGVTAPGNIDAFTTTTEGYYNVTVTDVSTGCVSNLVGTYVSFIPLPVVTISATSICDANPGLVSTSVNSANGLTYAWTVPAGATNPGSSPNFTTSVTGLYNVIVTDTGTGCISNQASTTVITQTSVTPTFTIPPSVCSGYTLPTTSDNGITGTWSPALLASNTYLFTPSFGQCATLYSTFITVNDGVNANPAPDLTQDSVTNNSTFNLTIQNVTINSDSGIQIDYYPSLAEAENDNNKITSPITYVNTSNPQTIGVRVYNLASPACAAITSFKIIVNNINNVYIADANFKTRLINIGIDTNIDGEIQFSEAAAVNELNLNSALIADLTGIEAFVNLTTLICSNNSLTNLNVNTLTNLTRLDCSFNQLTALNVSNLTNLKALLCTSNSIATLDTTSLTLLEELNCAANQLTVINVNSSTNLKSLICSNNIINNLSLSDLANLEHLEYASNQSSSLTLSNLPQLNYLDCSVNFSINSLNVSAFPLLQHLDLRYNSVSSLDVSGLPLLNYLDCSVNQLTSLNLTGLNNLVTLYAYNNFITTTDLTNLPNLATVYLANNQLSVLDFTGSPLVNYIYCNYNALTSLNLNGLTNLAYLYCTGNQLSTLNFAGLSNLYTVQCDHNLLTSLDFTTAPNLQILSCSFNNLSSINVKNGNSFIDTNLFYSWDQNPILAFVCVDDAKLAAVQQILNQSINVNNGNVTFNSYCSFVPGGNYNTISGQIKLDANNNGCDAGDATQPHVKVNIVDNLSNQGATFTDADGNYKFYVPAGSFTVSPEIENPTSFNFSPPAAGVFFPTNNNNTSIQDFCNVPNGIHQDIEIAIEPINASIPGQSATYKIVYKNKGNTVVSGSLNFNYNDSFLDFTSATVTPDSQSSGVLNWNYTNLLPFENRSFYVTFLVDSPANIGTILNFTASINPINTDENQGDNTSTFNQTVVGSYFPNSIVCTEGDLVSTIQIGNYLHYRIRFENIGGYLAQNVVLKLIIDTTKYDINTLQVLNSSNPVYIRISGNVVEFIFDNINLAAAHGNPPVGGHGDVLFKIRTKDDLPDNDTVIQKADIYFDYRFPVDTNDAATTFAALNNPIFEFDNSVKIYPNPTNSIINIMSDSNISSIELYDVQGRILQTVIENASSSKLDISGKSNGIYFLKIRTEKGSKVEKIVKQ